MPTIYSRTCLAEKNLGYETRIEMINSHYNYLIKESFIFIVISKMNENVSILQNSNFIFI